MRGKDLGATGWGTGGCRSKNFRRAMGETGEFGDAGTEEPLVAGVVIDHQVAAPSCRKARAWAPRAAALVVEHDDRGAGLELVAAISPQVGPLGLAAPGSSCWTGVSSACSTVPPSRSRATRRSGRGSAHPELPTHCARVERAMGTPWRALILSMR